MAVPAERFGRYTLVRSLGAGGMGELFLARADGIAGFAKLVAVKRIVAHQATNERHVRMLLDEARLVASLQHPNIAQVYDVGVENGRYFFAMEYVHGQDLRHVLHRAPNHRVQLENALHVAIGVCAGLHHAHEARDPSGALLGIVHRDVSPGNVLISYDGAVKLVDFGVAKATSTVSQTREGVVKGKYGYLSPEQCLGAPLDRRSDLFAVGILLWEMTVGRRLFKIQGELATLQRVVYVDAPRPSRFIRDVPPALEGIIMRALARDPAERYATAEQLQLDLEQFAVDQKLAVSPVTMSREMNVLFEDRLDAWRAAERRGRSLADHLAEAPASADVIDTDELDGVIGDLHTNVFAPNPMAEVPPPTRLSEGKARPRRALVIVGLLAMVGVAAGTVAFLAAGGDPALSARSNIEAPIARDEQQPVESSPVEEQPVESSGDVPAAPDASPHAELAVAPSEPTVDPEPEVEPPAKPRGKPATAHKHTTRDKIVRSQPGKKPSPSKVTSRDKPDVAVQDKPAPVTEAKTQDEPARIPPPQIKRDASPPAATTPAPGSVDAGAVRAVVRNHLAEIQACVSRARMDNRDLTGRVTMRIELSGKGAVTGTSVASSEGATPALESCMRKAVATWTFPAPAGGVSATIRYPFAF